MASETCPGGGMELDAIGAYSQGEGAIWQAVAPPGLEIVGAAAPPNAVYAAGVNQGSAGQYGGEFYWQGGSQNIPSAFSSLWVGPMASSYFGFLLVCGKPECIYTRGPGEISVDELVLAVHETVGPSMSASGLWQASSWVRGTWPLGFSGDSPSGVCSMSASLNGQSLPGSSSAPNPSVWHQCSAAPANDSVVTGGYAQGAMTLALAAGDAAGNTVGYSKTVYVDNQQPTISLSGPADAPSTAGTQYVTATAGAGPSGIDGISCSLDGAPAQWYTASSAQVPVSGVGEHSVRCQAANNAVDPAGNHGWSAPATATVKIGVPTVSAITFGHVLDALRCKRVNERVKIKAHWVTVRRHHKRVRVKHRARTKLVKVTRCHPRTKMMRVSVRVRVRRHGKKVWVTRRKRERVVLLPHVADSTTLRIKHGAAATVSGWLGTYTGVALASQTVTVFTALDNGLGQFTPVTAATTAANGAWSAALPAGPSRLIEAVYDGGPATEASVSAQVQLTVPAKIELIRVSPHHVAWGHSVRITGQLDGGYLPPGGALVRLRIGYQSTYITYGIEEHVTGNGLFSTTYTFGAGDPSVYRAYWFQLASLPIGDYPYQPAASHRSKPVIVGGNPPPRRPTRPPERHHKHDRNRRR